jgi:hypothetical protein
MPATWAVIIFDRFHHGEPDGEFLIEGFPNRELAREYACVFSIFVRIDIARLFRPTLQVHPRMIHPISS